MLVRPTIRARAGVPAYVQDVQIIIGSVIIAGGLYGIRRSLNRLARIMVDFDQVRADYKAYAQAQKDRADAAVAALEAAQTRAEASDQALADFQANDAATDAAQLLAQREADAAALQSDLDDVKGIPEPEEPVETPSEPTTPFPSGPTGDTDPVIPPVEAPPADEAPPEGVLPGDAPPVDCPELVDWEPPPAACSPVAAPSAPASPPARR